MSLRGMVVDALERAMRAEDLLTQDYALSDAALAYIVKLYNRETFADIEMLEIMPHVRHWKDKNTIKQRSHVA